MARYTLLRLMIFLVSLRVVPRRLRDVSEQWWLLGLSALVSTVVSYFVLRGPRAEFSAKIARRVDERAHLGKPGHPASIDESAEDVEADRGRQSAD